MALRPALDAPAQTCIRPYRSRFRRDGGWRGGRTPLAPLIAGSLPIIGWSAVLLMYWLPEQVQQALWAAVRGQAGQRIKVARVPLTSGEVLEVTRSDLRVLQLQQGWTGNPCHLVLRHDWGEETLSGADAMHAAALVLPAVNRFGGSPARVSEALEVVEAAGGVEALWERFARNRPALSQLPHQISLALEMAAHEEAEREALRGELAFLERAWKEAEEIAAIADQLVMPATIQRTLDRLRSKPPGLTS